MNSLTIVKKRNDTLSIVKAIGIILMVIGHSGCPKYLNDYLYMFHMPLFFFCSGYFFKKPTDFSNLKNFFKKRIKGLYLPYIEWTLFFIIIHNILFRINIYNDIYGFRGSVSHLYNLNDYTDKLFHLIFMSGTEQLLGGFWFLQVLFISSICLEIYFFINIKIKLNDTILLFILVIIAYISKIYNIGLPMIGSISLISMSCIIFIIGYYYKQYEQKKYYNIYTFIILTIFILIGSHTNYANMLDYDSSDILPYIVFSIVGVISIFCISSVLEHTRLKHILTYIGDNTMIILALHFISFKIVSLIKIYAYGLDIKKLAYFPVIPDCNEYFWILYTIIGVSIPLIVLCGYKKLKSNLIKKQ